MGDHAGRLDAASFFVFLFLLCLFVFCCLFPFSLSCFLPVDLDLFLDLCSSFCWWFFDLFVALFRCVSFICSVALYVPLHVLDATHYLWVPWRRGEMESEAAQGNVCTVYVISALN